MAKLRPRARIVRTIGDQLISGPEAAIIELVKNAFDADSPSVHIKISPPIDNNWVSGESAIIVSDTGHGMSASDILGKWFEPATSDKVQRRSSPSKGRTMLGAKGVGRFATARLGSKLLLTSVSSVSENLLELSEINVDWDQFEQALYLDEVDIGIKSSTVVEEIPTGVTLKITELRDRWSRKQLESLIKELRRLASPINTREDEFKIFLDASEFNSALHGFDGQSLVRGMVLEDVESVAAAEEFEIKPFSIEKIFHYKVEGEFDTQGAFVGTFVNNRGDAKPQSISMAATEFSTDEMSCGKVSLRLNIYDREGDAVVELFKRLGLGAIGRLEAKRVLDENIGIGLYREGFRIRPYGDAETDWLELERMRVQNPSKKLGLYQVWGLVEIDEEASSGLVERSSREGLEHNGSFFRLKRLITELLTHVETIRQDFRQAAGLSRKSAADTDNVRSQANLNATTRAVANLPVQYRNKLEKAIKQDSLALKTSIAELETYQQALASRSTLGLVVSQVLHDGRRFLSDINTRAKRLSDGASRLEEDSVFGIHFRGVFEKEASSIHGSASQLSKLFKALDPVSGKKRGRSKNFVVGSVVSRCLALFGDLIAEHNIQLSVPLRQLEVEVVGHESDLMAALLNIIDNAIHWLGSSLVVQKSLTFNVITSKKYVRLAISNNGPLIDERFHANLFSPGFSLKSEGSGIGLAIAREAMRASKGDVACDFAASETTFVIEMRRS